MTRRRPWARRTAVTAVSAAALVALAVPAEAATTATSTSPSTSTTAQAAAAEDVDYATWQRDCQRVMDQALPYLKQRTAATKPGEKQAIVFDIDNTTLETDFGFSYPQPANKPVLNVAEFAQEHGVSLFFVTARPGIISGVTDYNLKNVGYRGVRALRPSASATSSRTSPSTRPAQRVDIESKGYTDHREHRQQRHRPVGRARREDVQAS
ncbi:hypothetical protein SALBM311S_10745 [Streptomyces alboniger]